MSITKIVKLFVFFLLILSFQKELYAEDLESGEESLSGCPSANCECINDSARGIKEVDEEESDGGSSSSTGDSR